MRFDSAEFLFFFLVVIALHRVVPFRRALLIVASYAFYSSWNPPFLLLLLFSTALDFTLGKALERAEDPRRRKLLLGASLLGNLSVLAYFKYVNFFLGIAADLGADPAWLEPFAVDAEIPLGISFYTFQTLSYTIDVYRRKTTACHSLPDFALFVAFMPQLIAGPILRASEFIPQIRNNPIATPRQILEGLELCLVGLFKKVVLADTFALLVDRCYADPELYSGGALSVATLAFTAQIYCDFSGYSTMARGLGRMLGYHLPRNFDYPLLSGNPIDYRRGWHITIGTWFRDYLYRPLGGARRGQGWTIFNTMLTWSLFGFWHGANWTFLLWGFYNGVLLVLYRVGKGLGVLPGDAPWARVAGFAVMPVFLSLSVIAFRAETVSESLVILGRIVTLAPAESTVHWAWAAGMVALYGLHWASRLWYREGMLATASWPRRVVFFAGMMAVLYLFAGSGEPFYYFQF